MAGGPPRRPVEPTAGPDLDEGRRDEGQPVELGHAERGRRSEHQDHDPDRDRDRDRRGDEQAPRLALAVEVVLRDLVGDRARRCVGVGGVRSIANVVAGGFDGTDQGAAVGDVGQVADGRHLGREVDRRGLDAGRLAQEALDAVDAGRAGHPLDGKGQFGWSRLGQSYSLGVYHRPSCARLCEVSDPVAIYRQHPRSVGSVLRRRDGAWRRRGRLADDARTGSRRVSSGDSVARSLRPTRSTRTTRASATSALATGGARGAPRRRGPPAAGAASTWRTVRPGIATSSARSPRIPFGSRRRATARSPVASARRGPRVPSAARSAGTRSACSSRATGSSPPTARSAATAATPGAAARTGSRSSARLLAPRGRRDR